MLISVTLRMGSQEQTKNVHEYRNIKELKGMLPDSDGPLASPSAQPTHLAARLLSPVQGKIFSLLYLYPERMSQVIIDLH